LDPPSPVALGYVFGAIEFFDDPLDIVWDFYYSQ